ncbi:toll/interleukin-1 receptor domain-containing protein, partial [Acinetobacter baumannii]
MDETLKIFISYSWDSEEHKEWVGNLADCLEEDERFDVQFDQYDLDESTDRFHFMENACREADKIIVICTKNFKNKSDKRDGGVGVEAYMLTSQHFRSLSEIKRTKIITVKRDRDDCIPTYLEGQFYVDLSKEEEYEKGIIVLKKALLDERKRKRPMKKNNIELAPYYFTRVEDILKITHRNR